MEHKTFFSHRDFPSPFLRLPPEVRLQIYRLLLLSHQSVRMVRHSKNRSTSCPNGLFPAILSTCRLIHREATDVLYGENRFRAHRIDETNANAASISRAKFIIGLGGCASRYDDASKLPRFLEKTPNLKHLVLELQLDISQHDRLRRDIVYTFLKSGYSAKLKVRSPCSAYSAESGDSRPCKNPQCAAAAAKLETLVCEGVVMQKKCPELFKDLVHWGAFDGLISSSIEDKVEDKIEDKVEESGKASVQQFCM